MLIALLEKIYPLICRHEWIRDRRQDGTLGLRCMKCMKRKEYKLVHLIAWKPQAHPDPVRDRPDLAPDIRDAETRTAH